MRDDTQLTQEERYQIVALLKMGHYQSEIATVLKRHKSRAKPRLDPGTWEWVESLLCEQWSPEQLRADCRGAAGRVCQL